MMTKRFFLRLLLLMSVWAASCPKVMAEGNLKTYYQYNISVASNLTGAGTVYLQLNGEEDQISTSYQTVNESSSQDFVFESQANTNYFFLGWSNDNPATQASDLISQANPFTTTIYGYNLGSFPTLDESIFDESIFFDESIPGMVFYANFTCLKVQSENEAKGKATILGSPFYVSMGDDVSLKATAEIGYQFKEWRRGDDVVSSDNPYSFTVSDGTAGSYTAYFEESAGLTAHDVIVNQGSHGSLVADKTTATAGEAVTLTVLSDFGYETTAVLYDGTNASKLNDNHYRFFMPNDNVYVSQTCTPINYPITYQLDGGTADNPTVFNIETESFTLNNPTKTGYTFSGWKGKYLAEPTMTVTIPKGSVRRRSFTATWTANTYTVVFDPNGGSGEAMASLTFKYDETYTLPENTYQKTRCQFAGWNTQPDGSGTWYTDNSEVWNLTGEPNGTVTLYALWNDVPFFESGPDEFTIQTAEGWDVFCNLLANNDKGFFTGKTVKLGKDITVYRCAGSGTSEQTAMDEHPFTGTFDGQDHTLQLLYGDSESPSDEDYIAPFRYTNGATIKNLHVTGFIYTSHTHAAGIIGLAYGTTTVSNCNSSINIVSSVEGEGIHGGLIACTWTDATNTTIEGCVFNGSIVSAANSTTCCGGFIGWNNASVNVINSLLAASVGSIGDGSDTSDPSCTFIRQNTDVTITNCYYYPEPLGTVQGQKAYALSTAPANLGEEIDDVSYTVLTPYENGILFDGYYYVAPEIISLADNAAYDLSAVDDYVAEVTLSDRTLYKDASWNTLCLPFDLTLSGSVLDGDNVELMTLGDASFSDGTLYLSFVDADQIEAGKPYIVKWTPTDPVSHIVNPVFEGVTIDNASLDDNAVTINDVISFKGIYSPFEIIGENKKLLYLGDGDQLYYPSMAMVIYAFRAYFELQGDLKCGNPSSTDNGINAFVLNFDGETTSIDHLPLTIDHEADAWYDLSGRKLNGKPTQKGIYINNGLKTVIK